MKLTEAQVAHVKFLENERGQITAELVLADAQRADSPLNGLFDWDATKAAQAHWLDIARTVIRTVQILVVTESVSVRAPFYVRDPAIVRGQGYRAITALQRDPAAARESLINELTRAAGNLARAKSLALAFGLGDDMDALMEQVLGVRQRVNVDMARPDAAGTDLAL